MEAANSHERSAGAPAAPLPDLRSRDLKALARIEHDIDRLGLHEHVRHLNGAEDLMVGRLAERFQAKRASSGRSQSARNS